MGRIKGTLVKRVSREIMERYRDKLSSDFEKNKQFLASQGLQKKTKNSIAGYLARKVKKEEQKAKKK
jgi:small subunit ribosomal protein S17e